MCASSGTDRIHKSMHSNFATFAKLCKLEADLSRAAVPLADVDVSGSIRSPHGEVFLAKGYPGNHFAPLLEWPFSAKAL